MSVYRPLDEGVPGEIDTGDVSRRSGGGETPVYESTRPSAARGEPHLLRRAAPANVPFAATFRWVAGLPRHIRPIALLQQFPRIANVLARTWGDPALFRQYMSELLTDRRGGRQGFAKRIRAELLVLRAYFEEVHPEISRNGPRAP
jgi:hypothetical protein